MSERTTNLATAVGAALTERQKAADEAARPERERTERQAAADAKLMGTPAWDALGGFRRAQATRYATRPAVSGGAGDAA